MRVLVATLALGLLTLGTCTASAQGSEADTLFRKGREAADRGDYETACARFGESLRLDPATGTLLNLGDCEEHRGHLATALHYYQSAIGRLSLNDDRLPIVRERIASLRSRAPRVYIRVDTKAPSSTTVTLDGADVALSKLGEALEVDAGPHTIVVDATGFGENRYGFEAHPGQTQEVMVAPGDPVGGSVEPPVATPKGTPTPPESEEPSHGQRTLGFVVAGVGAVGLVVGTITGAMAIGKESTRKDNCDANDVCNQTGYDAAQSGKTLAGISTYAFVVGAAGITAGLFLVLTSPSHDNGPSADRVLGRPSRSEASGRTLLAPLMLPSGGGLTLKHTF